MKVLKLLLTVHPRRRGEHHSARFLVGHPTRFIPAGAGNTKLIRRFDYKPAVHPRRRGEHTLGFWLGLRGAGSSPQARGTQNVGRSGLWEPRFIPAGAGNTRFRCPGNFRAPVHPRRRGEHSAISKSPAEAGGSSPQARGTLMKVEKPIVICRFIPAGAGNTYKCDHKDQLATVHPRRRGEHKAINAANCVGDGSSPQARGTPINVKTTKITTRFIPAGAGNTLTASRTYPRHAVHPRRRGEHHIRLRNVRAAFRFIPAGAGNTRTS